MIDAQMLGRDLEFAFPLEVESVIQMKTVFGIRSTSGEKFVWKFIEEGAPVKRLWHMQQVFERMGADGITFAAPIRTKRGALALKLADGRIGYLQRWLPGKTVSYARGPERTRALRTIARFHRIASKLPLAERSIPADTFLYEKLAAKRQVMTQLWKEAREKVPKLKGIERETFLAMDLGVRASKAWFPGRASQFPRLQVPAIYTFCHRDLAPHNLVDMGDGVGIIDFDHAGLDDPFHDVMQISNHTVFVGMPSDSHFRDVVEEYLTENPQSPIRVQALWQLLRFPDILCRTVMEWGKLGFPENYRVRVLNAISKERVRSDLWRPQFERSNVAKA